MEVFAQRTRDALYGRYFLHAVQGKEPDLLRIINFTPTGVIFGRVPMIVSQHDEDSFTSTADYGADLLPVPGSKPIQVTRDGQMDRYVFNDTKTGKRYTLLESSANAAWPWSTEKPKPKSRKTTSGSSGSKRKAPSVSKKSKHDEHEQVEDDNENEQEDENQSEDGGEEEEEEVVVRKVSKPKPALKQTQAHAQPAKPAAQKAAQQQQQQPQSQVQSQSQSQPTAAPKKPLPVTNVSIKQPTPVRPVPKLLATTAPSSKSTRSPKCAETMDQIIDSSVPEIGEFLNDLRDGDD